MSTPSLEMKATAVEHKTQHLAQHMRPLRLLRRGGDTGGSLGKMEVKMGSLPAIYGNKMEYIANNGIIDDSDDNRW